MVKHVNLLMVQKDMMNKFTGWAKGGGSFYSVGATSAENELTEEPLAFIKVMNSVFPSNKADSTGQSPRERINKARDPNDDYILSSDDFYLY